MKQILQLILGNRSMADISCLLSLLCHLHLHTSVYISKPVSAWVQCFRYNLDPKQPRVSIYVITRRREFKDYVRVYWGQILSPWLVDKVDSGVGLPMAVIVGFPFWRRQFFISIERKWPQLLLIKAQNTYTRLRVKGWRSPNSDDWRKGLALCLLCG